MDDAFFIECIENETESSFFDFKRDIYDFSNLKSKEDFLIDIISFVNCHLSGNKFIITGVKLHKDNSRSLNGIEETLIQDGAVYQSLVDDNIEPTIIVDFKIINYNNLKFGVFIIKTDNYDKPYMLSKKYGSLPKGFIKIRKGQKNADICRKDFDLFYKDKTELSNIIIKGIVNDKISDSYELNTFKNKIDVNKAKVHIKELFNNINDTELIKSSNNLKMGNQLEIGENDINIIKNYADINRININKNFFEIGNISSFSLPNFSTSYCGTKSEKEKYKSINELLDYILLFEGFNNFYNELNKIYYVELSIENIGKKYDEDIEVTLIIPKSSYFDVSKFPIPSERIIDKIISNNFLDILLAINRIKDVNTYRPVSPVIDPIKPTGSIINGLINTKPSYRSLKEYYKEYLNCLMNYEVINEDNFYYIKFSQKDIKPNEIVLFPSKILLSDKIGYIDYEIKTKLNYNIQKGRIKINK